MDSRTQWAFVLEEAQFEFLKYAFMKAVETHRIRIKNFKPNTSSNGFSFLYEEESGLYSRGVVYSIGLDRQSHLHIFMSKIVKSMSREDVAEEKSLTIYQADMIQDTSKELVKFFFN